MSKKYKSLKAFLIDLWNELDDDQAFNGAAALAFYSMLAVFPAMIFLLTLIPYLPIPDVEAQIMGLLAKVLPEPTAALFQTTVNEVTGEKRGGLLSFGAMFTLWAASSGVHALMQQLNVTYGVHDLRSWFHRRIIALGLTIVFGILTITAFGLIMIGQGVEMLLAIRFDLPVIVLVAVGMIRWIIILSALCAGFALIYYFGPDAKQRFRFSTPGAVAGVILFILTSLAFRLYARDIGDYGATYGSIGAVIVLMLWFYIIGIVILVGSEINALLASRASLKVPKPVRIHCT